MKLYMRIQWNILMKRNLSDFGYQISAHGKKKQRITERQRRCRATSDRNTITHDMSQIHMFRQITIGNKAFQEQNNSCNKKYQKINNRLTILFKIGNEMIPSFDDRIWLWFWIIICLKWCHSGNICGSIQKILFCAFTIKSDRDQITPVIVHHFLKIFIS